PALQVRQERGGVVYQQPVELVAGGKALGHRAARDSLAQQPLPERDAARFARTPQQIVVQRVDKRTVVAAGAVEELIGGGDARRNGAFVAAGRQLLGPVAHSGVIGGAAQQLLIERANQPFQTLGRI